MFQFEQVSGHVFRREGARGPVWYAKYRLADGQQVQKRIGPAWTQRGRPADGYFTKRSAEGWLRELLEQARQGLIVRTGVLFEDAAAEWLRYAEEDRACKPTTMRDYRASVRCRMILFFGGMTIEQVTPQAIEVWRSGLSCLSSRSKNKLLTMLNGIFRRACRVYGLPTNPVSGVERLRETKKIDLEVLEPEEVWALVRAAADEQDAAIYLTRDRPMLALLGDDHLPAEVKQPRPQPAHRLIAVVQGVLAALALRVAQRRVEWLTTVRSGDGSEASSCTCCRVPAA